MTFTDSHRLPERWPALATLTATAAPAVLAADLLRFAEQTLLTLYRPQVATSAALTPEDLLSGSELRAVVPPAALLLLRALYTLSAAAAHGSPCALAHLEQYLPLAQTLAQWLGNPGLDAASLPPEAEARHMALAALLAAAGWEESAISRHEPLATQPAAHADYVLRAADERALAVIAVYADGDSASARREQAQHWASALEQQYRQRPLIFYSDGLDLWLWDDAPGLPPRKVQGFYAAASLTGRFALKALDNLEPPTVSAGRNYPVGSVRRVLERFRERQRKALVAQAAGVAQLPVALALTDTLLRAGAGRCLYLCEDALLREQARLEFAALPAAGSRCTVATYAEFSRSFRALDAGYFDLIVADEAQRNLYSHRDLLRHFDSLLVGLSQRPPEAIGRTLYRLFGCDDRKPTAYYPPTRAQEEGYLVPFEGLARSGFSRSDTRYTSLGKDERARLEEDGEPDPDTLQAAEQQALDTDSNSDLLRQVLEYGIRDDSGQQPGKTLIFSSGPAHAARLHTLFGQLYPHYDDGFCAVIDDDQAQLPARLAAFRDPSPASGLTIAILADPRTTGCDVPEVVNLVLARPLYSLVRLRQLLGRGTQAHPTLFGPGKPKTVCRVFDAYNNFKHFGETPPEAKPVVTKSLMQRLFETRITLAKTALDKMELDDFEAVIGLIYADLAALPTGMTALRNKQQALAAVHDLDVLDQFSSATVAVLRRELAPLLQWVNIRRELPAYHFDLLIAEMQIALLRENERFEDLKAELLQRLGVLPTERPEVRAHSEMLSRLHSADFWYAVTVKHLEAVRLELRSIMHLRPPLAIPAPLPPTDTPATRYVAAQFAEFIRRHPGLSAKQRRFLKQMQTHLLRLGTPDPERVQETTVMTVDGDSLEDVFPDRDAVLGLLQRINAAYAKASADHND